MKARYKVGDLLRSMAGSYENMVGEVIQVDQNTTTRNNHYLLRFPRTASNGQGHGPERREYWIWERNLTLADEIIIDKLLAKYQN